MGQYDKDFWHALDRLIDESKVMIDRPKGTHHPTFPKIVYPLDYGYLKGTSSMDGGGIDIWLGTRKDIKVDAVICTIDMIKKDSEIKLLLGCTNEEIEIIYCFHNVDNSMKGILIHREVF